MSFSRNIRRGILAGAVFLFFAACEREDREKAAGLPDLSATKSLVVLTWPDTYIASEVIDAYQRKTGTKIRFETFENLEEMQGKLASNPSAYDIVTADDESLVELIETRLLLPLDRTKLPNFSNLDDRFTNLPFDPGNRYSVPYLWGLNVVAYRNDKVESPEPSWNLLWDPELKNKVVMPPFGSDLYSAGLLSLGYSINSGNLRELEDCTEKLIAQAEEMEVAYRDLFSALDLLEKGDAWAGLMYSGDAARLAKSNPNISCFVPREGSPLWMDSLAISRDTKNAGEAHSLVNFLLEAKNAAANANFFYGGNPNAAAQKYLAPALLANEIANPPKPVLERCEYFSSGGELRKAMMGRGMKRILDISRAALKEAGEPGEPGELAVKSQAGS